jgi:pimeloyl-ACP methyl ester carboxylesterase
VSLRLIQSGGVSLATQSFGNPRHPPVLLIMGGMASMLWWPQEFCERLADHGRHVIRYDQRDTGLSTRYPPGRPGYGFDDAVDDTVRILDGCGIATAHVVGFSLGGMVGQGCALAHAERVLSLTAIDTTPIGLGKEGLPQPEGEWSAHAGLTVKWSDRTASIDYMVEDARLIAGTAHPFDEARTRRLIESDFDRSGGYASAANHSVLFEIGEQWEGRIGGLLPPLLVIHGTADPVFPLAHGVALCEAVAGARLLKLDGGGHELSSAHWDQIIAAVVDHTA